MFDLAIRYMACGEEIFVRDSEGFETWAYSCNSCEEAEKKAKKLQKLERKNEDFNSKVIRLNSNISDKH